MSAAAWTSGTATAIGSMPGTDPLEAARTVAGELPELMPFPELPQRGVGADLIGRTAGLLAGLAVEVAPSGYRVAARPGADHRRALDLISWDLDAVEQAVEEVGTPEVVKIQIAGPWTLTASVELRRGHRVLTDHGALRDFTSSLIEGLAAHLDQVARRTGSRVLVQVDEASLPAVLAGDLPTPSGYGTVPAVPEPEAQSVLGDFFEQLRAMTGEPVVAHCCAPRPPVALLRRAGAQAIALDATGLGEVSGDFADELGEAWEEGASLFLGLVPSAESGGALRDLARPAFDLAARLGFGRSVLAEHSVPTPTCGLAGAGPGWARRALRHTRDLARLFADESDR